MCESSTKFLAEAEGRYIRQASSIDHYAIVKLRIYMIDTDAVLFENYCSEEQLPQRFAADVEKAVQYYAEEHNISKIQVCLLDGEWQEYDPSEMDFILATLKALFEVFLPKR